MEIVDLHLHEPAPFEDWSSVDEAARRRVMTESLWQSMDAVGVDAEAIGEIDVALQALGAKGGAEQVTRLPIPSLPVASVLAVPNATVDAPAPPRVPMNATVVPKAAFSRSPNSGVTASTIAAASTGCAR